MRPLSTQMMVVVALLASLVAVGLSVTSDGVALCEDCDPTGSLSQLCAAAEAGGMCLDCKPGVGGLKCNECLSEFYNFSDTGCSACGCHPNASTAQQCDESGVCECVTTATGDKCDVCADGYHIIESGCIACPRCYDEVAVQFNRTLNMYHDLLRQINSTLARLDQATSGDGSGDLGDFVTDELLQQLKDYQVTLEELLVRAVNATKRENEMKALLRSLIKQTNAFEEDVKELERNVTSAENVTFELSDLLEQINENLTQVEELLTSSETKLKVEIWPELERAIALNKELGVEYEELRRLTMEVNSTSHEQEAIANSLLEDIMCALENVTRALELLDETISLQNLTLAEVRRIEEDILPPLIEIYMEARNTFIYVDTNVPIALDEANRLLKAVGNVSIPEFDLEPRHSELDELEAETLELSISASAFNEELDDFIANFTSLNSSAVELLLESEELNMLAQELLAIAHGAQALANDSVEKGNAVIAEAMSILSQLQEKLLDAENFTAALDEVIKSIEMAENDSVTIEERAERSVSQVMEVASVVNMAAQRLQNASQTLATALELANQLNLTSAGVLDNATSINSAAQELASNVSLTTDKVEELEQTVAEDKRTIAMTTETARESISVANDIKQEIVIIRELLSNLSLELNSTVLISPNRIAEVNQTLTFLEEEAAANQEDVDQLADQIRQLQESADELRERYSQLQQHRDLLGKILGNIEGLDCRNQFVRAT